MVHSFLQVLRVTVRAIPCNQVKTKVCIFFLIQLVKHLQYTQYWTDTSSLDRMKILLLQLYRTLFFFAMAGEKIWGIIANKMGNNKVGICYLCRYISSVSQVLSKTMPNSQCYRQLHLSCVEKKRTKTFLHKKNQILNIKC